MSATAAPYGIQPVSDQQGTVRPLRIPLGINNTLNVNIFKYQAVKIDTTHGTITPVTATTDGIYGIFAGCEFTPLGGRPAESPFWPANTNYDTTYDMFAYIWPCWIPGTRFMVQADGSVAQSQYGRGFAISNFANGNTSTGLGSCTLAAAGVGGSTVGQFDLVEFATEVTPTSGNTGPGDAFTDLIVTIAKPLVGFAGQNSIA